MSAAADAPVLVRHLGLQPYAQVWEAMRTFTEQRTPESADEIWLLEHPPVFTLGLNGKREHLLNPGDIPVLEVDRGGQVTYHGPGQAIVYLLLDLRRRRLGVRQTVSLMEQAVIDVLAQHGVSACARADAPGVYVDGAKVAALGLRVRRGSCYHGLSLNVNLDLAPFARINPCGYRGQPVTRLADLGISLGTDEAARALLDALSRGLGTPTRDGAGAAANTYMD